MVELALYIIGCAIAYFIAIFALSSAIAVIGAILEGIQTAWKNLNSFGRAVFFGGPMLIAAYFLFSFIFYTIVPFYLANEIVRIISYIFLGIVVYLSLIEIGWCEGNFKVKNLGVIPLIARIIFLLPYMPVLYIGFYIKQIFCKAFISNSYVSWNPHFITREHKCEPIVYTKREGIKIPEFKYTTNTSASDAMEKANDIIKMYKNFIDVNYK